MTALPGVLATKRFAMVVLVVGALGLVVGPAAAGFIECRPGTDVFDTPTFYDGRCIWVSGTPAESNALSTDRWGVKLREVTSLGQPRLLLDLQHKVAPHPAIDIAPSPTDPFTFDTGTFPPGADGVGVRLVPHSRRAGVAFKDSHFDDYIYIVERPEKGDPANRRKVEVQASHVEKKPNSVQSWSYRTGRAGKITVHEIQTGQEKQIRDKKALKRFDEDSDKLSDKAIGYRILFTVGDPISTEATVGYVEGSAGSFTLADMALLSDVFLGVREFFAPMLFDPDEVRDLFMAVNLVPWLLLPHASFVIGDEFHFSGGTSPDLPGILLSFTPIRFDPAVGFTTDSPATLDAVVGGVIDGKLETVSSLPAFGLAAVGLIGLLACRLRRPRRARLAEPGAPAGPRAASRRRSAFP